MKLHFFSLVLFLSFSHVFGAARAAAKVDELGGYRYVGRRHKIVIPKDLGARLKMFSGSDSDSLDSSGSSPHVRRGRCKKGKEKMGSPLAATAPAPVMAPEGAAVAAAAAVPAREMIDIYVSVAQEKVAGKLDSQSDCKAFFPNIPFRIACPKTTKEFDTILREVLKKEFEGFVLTTLEFYNVSPEAKAAPFNRTPVSDLVALAQKKDALLAVCTATRHEG